MLQDPHEYDLTDLCRSGFVAFFYRKDAAVEVTHQQSGLGFHATRWCVATARRWLLEFDWDEAELRVGKFVRDYQERKARDARRHDQGS
jgi:hypothetical protein